MDELIGEFIDDRVFDIGLPSEEIDAVIHHRLTDADSSCVAVLPRIDEVLEAYLDFPTQVVAGVTFLDRPGEPWMN